MSFEMTTPDNRQVTVKLNKPICDMMSDFVEVYGSVNERGNIICTNYSTFEPMYYANFGNNIIDILSYNYKSFKSRVF